MRVQKPGQDDAILTKLIVEVGGVLGAFIKDKTDLRVLLGGLNMLFILG